MIRKYRAKPVVVEAVQFEGTENSAAVINAWMRRCTKGSVMARVWAGPPMHLSIPTEAEGCRQVAHPGDWIIRGVRGEFSLCRPETFTATHAEVKEPGPDALKSEER